MRLAAHRLGAAQNREFCTSTTASDDHQERPSLDLLAVVAVCSLGPRLIGRCRVSGWHISPWLLSCSHCRYPRRFGGSRRPCLFVWISLRLWLRQGHIVDCRHYVLRLCWPPLVSDAVMPIGSLISCPTLTPGEKKKKKSQRKKQNTHILTDYLLKQTLSSAHNVAILLLSFLLNMPERSSFNSNARPKLTSRKTPPQPKSPFPLPQQPTYNAPTSPTSFAVPPRINSLYISLQKLAAPSSRPRFRRQKGI